MAMIILLFAYEPVIEHAASSLVVNIRVVIKVMYPCLFSVHILTSSRPSAMTLSCFHLCGD